MPGSGLRARTADVVRPGRDGCQIVVAQKLPQFFRCGIVQVVPGNVGNDPVTFISPRPCLGMGKCEYEHCYCRQPTADEAETHDFDDSVEAFVFETCSSVTNRAFQL